MKEKFLDYKVGVFGLSLTPRSIFANPMFAGSAVMIVGSNIANFFAYIFHLVIGRMLGPADYGELAATITLVALILTSFSFLSLVVVKFISSSQKKDIDAVIGWFSKIGLYISGALTVLLIFLTPLLADFFHIHRAIIYVLSPIIGVSVVSTVLKSFLQGLLLFDKNVISTNIQMIGRFVLAVTAVYLGWGVFGAVVALLIAMILDSSYSAYHLRKYSLFGWTGVFHAKGKVLAYAFPLVVSTIATNAMISTDVLLVKHYFSSFDAGLYASLSNLGKIIFFGTAPIMTVMFPLIAKRHSQNKDHKNIFLLSLGMTLSVCIGVTGIYALFPELMVELLYGEEFISAASILYLFGIFISIYTLGTLLLNYFLSRDDTKVASIALVAALLQYILVTMYHSSITQVIFMSIISSLVLTLPLAIYYGYKYVHPKKHG